LRCEAACRFRRSRPCGVHARFMKSRGTEIPDCRRGNREGPWAEAVPMCMARQSPHSTQLRWLPRCGGRDAEAARGSEVGLPDLAEAILIVHDLDPAPLVEGRAGVRDPEADEVAEAQRDIVVDDDVGVLIVQLDDPHVAE
jgi:hypothetical protein